MQNKRNLNLRNPKIYNPPKEKSDFVFPKYLKGLIVVAVLLGLIIASALYLPIFKIEHLEIVGAPNESAIEYLERNKGENIFLTNAKKLEKDLIIINPAFINIEVSKGLPGTLRISFEERSSKMIWRSSGKSYLLDSEGYAYREIPSDGSVLLPKVVDNKNLAVSVPSQIVTENFVTFVTNLNSGLGNIKLAVKQYEVDETTFQIAALLDSNIKIIFDTTRNLTDQIDAVNLVYFPHKAEIKQYLDVRVEGKAYFQ